MSDDAKKEAFWEAVQHIGSLPDEHAKLVAEQAALVGDMREKLLEQDEELHTLRADYQRMCRGLEAAADALWSASQAVAEAIPPGADHLFSRLQGGWMNLMAYVHGDPDYLTKGGLSTRHIDLRAAPARKTPARRSKRQAENTND